MHKLCYYDRMNLSTYFIDTRTKKTAFARAIKVSPSLLHQWLRGIRPIAIQHGAAIERASGGAVTRKDLFPNTWADIWPELATTPTESQP